MSTTRALPPLLARLDLDFVEKFLVATFMVVLTARLVPVIVNTGALAPLFLIMSEGVVVLFILLRRPTRDISRRLQDWALGLAGTLLPLLAIAPSGHSLMPIWLCEAVMLAGFALQMSAKLTLRRSFGVVAANRGVKASGPYRLVRHPMYAGYALTHVGFLLVGPTLWNLIIYGGTLTIAVHRILAEERVLGADPAYQAFRGRVRYRLLPGLF